jgi:hypothetical protein
MMSSTDGKTNLPPPLFCAQWIYDVVRDKAAAISFPPNANRRNHLLFTV